MSLQQAIKQRHEDVIAARERGSRRQPLERVYQLRQTTTLERARSAPSLTTRGDDGPCRRDELASRAVHSSSVRELCTEPVGDLRVFGEQAFEALHVVPGLV